MSADVQTGKNEMGRPENYAILYLDDLSLVGIDSRAALAPVRFGSRPFQILRQIERAGRRVWAPRETNYRSKV